MRIRFVLTPCLAIAIATVSLARPGNAQEKVLGLGGVFFRAKNPAMLAEWYEKHLGITRVPKSYDQQPWIQLAGPTVFAPFPNDTKYFDRPEQAWMMNFRVRDLDAMVRQLRAAGIEVKVDPQEHPNGRFARTHDPEGNPIELWQPKSQR
jgi:glyoxylase I family protein